MMMAFVILMFFLMCASLPPKWDFECVDGPDAKCIYNEPDPFEEMPINLTIAFWGDQGIDPSPTTGFRKDFMRNLVEVDKVEAFMHVGDFDYRNDPESWDDMITSALGDDFPYFSAIGNHDLPRWYTYKELIYNRWEKFGAKCWGDVGRGNVCSYKGFTFIISAIGVVDVYPPNFVLSAFSDYGGLWRACLWHKNQHILQLGDKTDEVGWPIYNYCRQQGALIINGHEHSYCRSKIITDFRPVAPIFENEGQVLVTGPNVTFVSVVGTAGIDIRPCTGGKENNPWWASAWCAPKFDDVAGVTVCLFNYNGDARLAHCYYKTYSGEILDSYRIRSDNQIQSYKNNSYTETYDDGLIKEIEETGSIILGILSLILIVGGSFVLISHRNYFSI